MIGAIFGSFYYVVAYRIPKGESIIAPPSHCPNCNHRLGPLELIPIFSFLLQGGNNIYCNHCHSSSNAYMYPKLCFTPKILVLVLNRGRGNIYQVKVDYPQYFDISPFVPMYAQYKKYELIGVITHLGESGPGGHFIAICKSRIDKQWYLFNDQTTTKCTFNDALNKGTPYILFYHYCN
jgi:ubiquitin C-terminal hydrolase